MVPNDAKRRLIHCPGSPLEPILAALPRIARSRAPVLVTGESGTGKEGVVRSIHELAPWGSGPFVPVNCGAIPGTLLESELFGHVRGAFTGADRNRIGRFEAASGGTLFLDEIGEMPLELQVKLLRVLAERVFVPVGASTPRTADVRIVAATNANLTEAVKAGRFREDLFFRLDVIRIELPALRDRMVDVPALVRCFIARHAAANLSTVDDITPAALDALMRYPWPGNVRELENAIQRILVMKESGAIELADVVDRIRQLGPPSERAPHAPPLPLAARPPDRLGARLPDATPLLPAEGVSLKHTLDSLERAYIREALVRSNGNRARAAALLGLNRTTLVEKLRRMPEWSSPDVDSNGPAADHPPHDTLTH